MDALSLVVDFGQNLRLSEVQDAIRRQRDASRAHSHLLGNDLEALKAENERLNLALQALIAILAAKNALSSGETIELHSILSPPAPAGTTHATGDTSDALHALEAAVREST
ncbi:MAG TPA: hypothetical protein VF624_04065 [Tepidisphaeraceae bacterium]|jgi:hypothetical protein